jgi:serine/threonine protein phosphatase PrpC
MTAKDTCVCVCVCVCVCLQVRVHHLTAKDKFMVICSDGVWEFLTNEDVVR